MCVEFVVVSRPCSIKGFSPVQKNKKQKNNIFKFKLDLESVPTHFMLQLV